MDIKERRCEVFNANNPVGSSVMYLEDDGSAIATEIKAEAAVLGGHTPVIWLVAKRGAVNLDRVTNRRIE